MSKNNTFIIGELSANHNNDFDIAVRTIEAIAEAGADAVKIQTYKPESMTLNIDNKYFGPRTEGLWKGRKPYELFMEAGMNYDWQPKLQKVAKDLGLTFFSSPFDLPGVDFLEDLNVPMYKIASLEITHIPLIEYVASKGKPIILSTGAAKLSDIELAIETCRNAGNNDITILKCTAEYPAPFEEANLKTIPNLIDTFGVKVGVSDHTMGSTVPIVAVALGATVVEKHFILDRSMGGPDSAFSMEPDEFKFMVDSIREAEKAIGTINYNVPQKRALKRRSIFVSEEIKEGDILTENNIKVLRPGNGMHPIHYKNLLGSKAIKGFKKGEPYI
ncbi:pseudaminic acid synthase [Salegentibacter salarius]|uniref:Pseudaminic acid synthase n=1 Tax=Salegentibacter salarius TaxID=435906 RepID=A0A2N0U5I9_9FLAO|nr:pseudaminic acid synthase [Salegentibacter salarius]OEY73948.1 pseudaminic acid synthase [Salegentibacter salarius]PKD22148.1 pseudaminic acid synthase [Salegentibacter salarius]SLJ86324.1 pseudaminic acid synthase [Salegentibacter salarius]